jgi:hypothetical protein
VRLLAARPALGWALLALALVLNLAGYQTGGLVYGALVAACFYPSTPDDAMLY